MAEAKRLDWRPWIWPGVVVALLTGQLAVCGVMIVVSSTDMSVAVEPNYYEQALAWDQSAAQSQRSRALGWSACVSADRKPDAAGGRATVVTLRDRDGSAICGATVRVTAFHHAHARDRFEAELIESGAGQYAARLPLQRDGLWEFRIHAQRDGDVYAVIQAQPIGVLGSVAK